MQVLIWPILTPNLANFEKLKSRTHTYLKSLLESRFWVEKSKRAKRYAHGSSFAQKVPNRATLLLTKVAKWFFGRLLLVQKVCQASSWWLNGGQNGEGGAIQKIHPVCMCVRPRLDRNTYFTQSVFSIFLLLLLPSRGLKRSKTFGIYSTLFCVFFCVCLVPDCPKTLEKKNNNFHKIFYFKTVVRPVLSQVHLPGS